MTLHTCVGRVVSGDVEVWLQLLVADHGDRHHGPGGLVRLGRSSDAGEDEDCVLVSAAEGALKGPAVGPVAPEKFALTA